MAKRKQPPKKQNKRPENRKNPLPTLLALAVVSALLAWLSLATPAADSMLNSLQSVVKGLAGDMALLLPIVIMALGVYNAFSRSTSLKKAGYSASLIVLMLCVMTGVELMYCPELKLILKYPGYPNFVYNAYLLQAGGGVLGSLSWFLYNWLEVPGGMIAVCGVGLMALAMLTHADIGRMAGWLNENREKHDQRVQKKREERELNEMFDYDDFEDRPRRRERPAQPQSRRPRTAPAAAPRERELFNAVDEDLPQLKRRRSRPVEEVPPVNREPRRRPVTDIDADDAEIPEIRSNRARRTAPAAEKPASVKTVRPAETEDEPIAPITGSGKYFDEDDIDSVPTLRRHRSPAPADEAVQRPRAEAKPADPFAVQRTKLKDASPIDGNDFAGGHMKDVHGLSALHGQTVGGTIPVRPRPPQITLDKDEDEDAVPMAARDLTIEPDEYEQPDDEPPFDVDDDPAKKLGKFTRRTAPKPEDEEEQFVYNYPPIDLLSEGNRAARESSEEIDLEKAQELEDTLRSFGVDATMSGIAHGPAVTRFEFKLPRGVKVNKITGLADDIAYSLAAESVRIEAPIPGKTAVGVELPNDKVETVLLRDVLESAEARNHSSRVAVGLGKDNAGRYIVADIAKMPHVLIAGQTGSGKSVCINSIIMSILFRSSPEEVKMILIDPKMVELSVYNEIPHLIAPVVTDPQKAAAALDWAVVEMTNRYTKFKDAGVRNIKGYNSHLPEGEKPMPQIVIIIDELADLMMAAPGEVENSICRLAQLARAAGMYLVIATQRPSVNVITGVIKANVPSRIAFKVASNIDSRTIFDSAGGVGAEKLLGNGDMLFVPSGISKPLRVQGAWVSDSEVENVVEFIKARHENGYDENFMEHMNRSTTPDAEREEMEDDECDDRLEEAVEIVIDAGQASISMLQRKMRVGYARAGRLIDEMCRRGIVSEADGSKPRTVLITKEQFYNAFIDD